MRCADVSVKRLEILENLDQLKMIGCPGLVDQGEGFDARIPEAVRDELLEQLHRSRRWLAVHRVYVDMGDDEDLAETGGVNGQRSGDKVAWPLVEWRFPARAVSRSAQPAFD